jgi:hypothetical protein
MNMNRNVKSKINWKNFGVVKLFFFQYCKNSSSEKCGCAEKRSGKGDRRWCHTLFSKRDTTHAVAVVD